MGTTGLLVLSSVLVLALGSTLVAFNGWPGVSGGDEPESVVVQPAAVAGEPDAGPEQIAAIAAPAAESVADAVSSPPAQAPVTVVPGTVDRGSAAPAPEGVEVESPPPPGPGEPSDPTDTTPPPPAPPPGPGTLTDQAADGLETTTTYLGEDVVSQLSPDLGRLLTQAGQGLTDLVRALDGTPRPPR